MLDGKVLGCPRRTSTTGRNLGLTAAIRDGIFLPKGKNFTSNVFTISMHFSLLGSWLLRFDQSLNSIENNLNCIWLQYAILWLWYHTVIPKCSKISLRRIKKNLRSQWCWWHRYVGDLKLVTICGCWWLNFDVGDIFWMLVPDANVKR